MNNKLAKIDLKSIMQQGGRYLIVGLSSAAIELVLFFLLYEVLGLYVVASNVIALTTSTIYNFTMSKNWTFKSTAKLARTITLYLTLFVFNQLFSSFAIVWLIDLGLHSILAKVITMACIVLWNFVLYRKVVFR